MREGCYPGGPGASVVLAAEAYFHSWLATYEKVCDHVSCPQLVRQAEAYGEWLGWRRHSSASAFPDPAFAGLRHTPAGNAPFSTSDDCHRRKGVEDLLAAMAQLPNIRLVVAAMDRSVGNSEATAHKPGLQNITFAGHVSGEALEKLIADSQFTIFPSRAYETLGKSILESYARGARL